MSQDIELKEVAKMCIGMSGADLANVLNEAAIHTARADKKEITIIEIKEAINKIKIGLEQKGKTFSEHRQKLVSYHEAGHALVGMELKEFDSISQISIVPRGQSGGITVFTPNEEQTGLYTKQYLLDKICVSMGGRVAEELIFGKDLITTGAQNDLESATKTAKLMVEQFGMGSVNRIISKEDGPLLLESISLEIDELLERQYQRSKEIITSKRGTLDLIASLLQEYESLDVK